MDLIRYEEPLYVDEIPLKWERFLGQGSYGFVTLMVNRFTNQFYAKKTSRMMYKEELKKELRIMLHFRNHPRIIQAASASFYEVENCYIYMEYASEGTLEKLISSFNGKPMPEDVIEGITRMILQGLEALHSQGYVHCDLKASNVFLFPSTSQEDPWDVKLADFGLSKEPNTEGVMETASDIWSLGCLILKMFGCNGIMGDDQVLDDQDDISPVAVDFLRQCHALYPSDRASATMLLNHAFIKQRVSSAIPHQIPTSQHCLNHRTGPLPTPIGPPEKQQEPKRKVNNVLHDWDIDVTEEVFSTVAVETQEATEAADLEERSRKGK